MSAVAKKMMEKYGWKEGEGLGKERSGIKSYVKVTRRDPHTATGLGHAADPAQAGSLASAHAIELDAIYGELRKETTKRQQRSSTAHGHPADEGASSDMGSTTSNSNSSSAVITSEREKLTVADRAAVKRQRRAAVSSPSNSGSDSDDCTDSKRSKNDHVSDVTRMSDKELFQRCGGVRLGRAGRHRFFDGKLKRIHDSS
ncbi:hypothetical protein LSCM1_05562 [Leishmania martiniquensis]|uniref:G-patch domain-containing protein n=1 Tax=Leishmania martiniquensis TaxID=1580590 RepID=A0A836HRZ3_9TRYP|nr:hypothetical protein LSCM1_05562 [Leishmania martiniquensis]